MKQGLTNSKTRDTSSKIIFEDPILCAQFLRGYLDIPLLKNVRPEDIEDVSGRYIHMFVEERESDVVKRVHIQSEGIPFYLVSLIEHKSNVDYNVVMQVFRYMAFIWEDYEKEMEKQQPGISKTKEFRYPPVLPIVFYDGKDNWTAATKLHDRVLLSDVLGEYIPDYHCALVQLNHYSNGELMKREDVLSVIMMIANLHQAADFVRIGNDVSREYLQEVFADAPEYLLEIVEQVVKALLLEINVPDEEVEEFSGQIKEKRMGKLFANFEPYDVQATRREAKREAKEDETEKGIQRLVKVGKKHGFTQKDTAEDLVEQYGLSSEEAGKKVELYW